MGVGTPQDLVEAVSKASTCLTASCLLGMGERARRFTSQGKVNIKNARWIQIPGRSMSHADVLFVDVTLALISVISIWLVRCLQVSC